MKWEMLCEYMRDPVGIDTAEPLLSWCTDDPEAHIDRCRVTVRCDGEDIVWDSGTLSGNPGRVTYAGMPLKSGRTYRWRLDTQKDGKDLPSGEARFTTGLIGGDTWRSPWLGGIKIDQNSYMYRCGYTVRKPLRSAAAFVATPCYYVLTVNGRRADDTVLNNIFADYDKSLYYRTYDLTGLLHEGKNALGVMTGLGWHSLREAEDGIGWGDSLFSLQLLLVYTDGEEEWIVSDPDAWKYATDGPVLYNSIYNGERYDARREKPGWDCPDYDASGWNDTVEREPPAGVLRPQMAEPIRVTREILPERTIPGPDGTWTLDFGRNFAGWVRMRVRGNPGDTVTVKVSEKVKEDGSADQLSLRNAHPVDSYTLKGNGEEEVWEPRFTYHGFRYAQIGGLGEKPAEGMFIGCEVRTDAEETGFFRCGHPVVQGFYDIMKQTERSNQHGVPTDCPQRDERLGWLNDMTVRNEGALYGFRLYQMYMKWLRDIRDTQGAVTGAITDTAPFLRYGFRPADPVSASFLLIPWNLYLHYGDKRPLLENYDANARWVRYLERNSKDLIVRYSSMGDWAAPVAGTDHGSTGGGALSTITPQLLMSTGYLYYDCTLMAKMAGVLGKNGDMEDWLALAEKVRAAFNRTYFHEDEGYYAGNSQAANILPLYFGITDGKDTERVLAHLCADIEAHGGHLTTGNLCTRYAIEVLFRFGKHDLAWHLLSQTEYPSWGFMLKNGATTIWERWEKVEDNPFLAAMAALNHPMNGGAVVSLYKHLTGIAPDENAPGFEHTVFRPCLPDASDGASAELHTVRGTVAFRWKRETDGVSWEASVPDGCTGTVYPPDGSAAVMISSGITRGRWKH